MRYFKSKTGDVSAYSYLDIDTAKNANSETPQVFHDIKAKLKNLTELKGADLEQHLNPPITDNQARSMRDSKLIAVDAYVSNPLRWADTAQADKDTIAAYRIALLDVPEQKGFPSAVVWPELPEVML